MKENDIEDMFKEKFEDFEPEVDSKVWKNVKTGLKVAGAGVIGKFLMNKLGTNAIIAIVSSIATVIATVGIMNITGDGDKKETAEKPNVIVEPPKQLTPQEIKEFLKTEEGNATTSETKTENNTHNHPENTVVNEIIKPKQIANIQANTTSGVVPLYVDINNIGSGKKNIWMLGDKKNTNESPMYYFDKPGVYTIKLISTDAKGRTQRDSIKIDVQANSEVPTNISFSPNGDGKNDFFSVALQNISEIEAEITNRNGELIFKWSGKEGKWDGNDLKGQPAKADVYYYLLKTVDETGTKMEYKGAVKLNR